MHAREIAAAAACENVDLVIAAGGDGTVNEVACGLALSKIPLLVLPCGTANVLSKELTLPERIPQLINAIPQMTRMRIAIGKGDDRYFVMMAGIGIDAEIIYELRSVIKQQFGEFGFWLEALRHWTHYRFAPFRVNTPEACRKATFAVIGRGSWYAGGVKITSRADLTTDSLDVCLFMGSSRISYLRYLAGVVSGSHPYFHDVEYLNVQSVQMTSEFPIRVQMDGESAGVLPMTFHVIPDALTLLAPEGISRPRQS